MKGAELIATRTEVFTLPENATVLEAARFLREKRTRAVGIVNAEGKLVGVVSQSDIADKVAAMKGHREGKITLRTEKAHAQAAPQN